MISTTYALCLSLVHFAEVLGETYGFLPLSTEGDKLSTSAVDEAASASHDGQSQHSTGQQDRHNVASARGTFLAMFLFAT